MTDPAATDPSTDPTTLTDEEYALATSPRNVLARQRGLPTPYIPGGIDPDADATRREERRYLRLLLAMVILIVGGGFTISIIGLVLQLSGR